jgi:polyhydroxyalkanoate synthesis repressor PhaR
MRLIKRYPNRKLYDTERKEYITLERIADLIREGEDFHVVDNANGEDLTAVTLTQIIFDQEKKKSGFLPRSVLSDLIQAGGSRLNAIQRSLLSQMGFLRQVDEEIRQRFELLVSQGEIAEQEADRLMAKLVSSGRETLLSRSLPSEAEIERALEKRQVPTRQDLDKILNQLDALMTKLETISSEDETPSP